MCHVRAAACVSPCVTCGVSVCVRHAMSGVTCMSVCDIRDACQVEESHLGHFLRSSGDLRCDHCHYPFGTSPQPESCSQFLL